LSIKPYKISLFIFLILLVLFGLTFLSKADGIKNKVKSEQGFTLGSISIKYPTKNHFLKIKNDSIITLADVKAVTQSIIPIEEEPVSLEKVDTLTLKIKKDSILSEPFAKKPQFAINLAKIDTTKIRRIQYPKGHKNFVEKLQQSFNSNNCRIIHYGDSQLEGDRITSYLRNRLQGLYGGNGPGFIPIKQVYHQLSGKVTCSENWERYARFDRSKPKFSHHKYGAYLSVSRFTPFTKSLSDSLSKTFILDTISKATIDIGKSLKSYRNFRVFNQIGLHYGNATHPTSIKVFNNGALIQMDTLITDKQYHLYQINLHTTPSNLHIELEGKVSPDFYGLTLDSNKGIQIDNVAMRGASGTFFTKTDSKTFADMNKTLNPKLILLQYGGNTVPYLKDSLGVQRYGRYISSQIKWIKKRTHQAQVLFIGPTDMCTTVNGKMETYPLLPYLNQVLMQNCLKNNTAYWSMFDAMGGKGAMKIWVDEKLAGSDYTHFTAKGTKVISELLFTSLYLDLMKTKHDE